MRGRGPKIIWGERERERDACLSSNEFIRLLLQFKSLSDDNHDISWAKSVQKLPNSSYISTVNVRG